VFSSNQNDLSSFIAQSEWLAVLSAAERVLEFSGIGDQMTDAASVTPSEYRARFSARGVMS